MMISKLSVRNFKCLRDVDVDLQRFTMFVGANGSGKSSILEALDLACRSFRSDATSSVNDLRGGITRGAEPQVQVAIEAGSAGYYLGTGRLKQNPVGQMQSWDGEGCGFTADFSSGKWQQWKRNAPELELPPQSVLLRLETSHLRSAKRSQDGRMGFNGQGLHSALANMALNDPDAWQRLQADLRLIVPMIRRLRHTPAVGEKPAALLFDTEGADSLGASQMSEGTLLVLGLLAAIHAAERPNLVLLDDLDHGLHPKAQRDLISLLRDVLAKNTDLQLLATTHSPYMLDCMDPAEVRMTYRDGARERGTVCAPLERHPDFAKWKDEMHPGELWSLFGEEWVAEPVPVKAGADDEAGGA